MVAINEVQALAQLLEKAQPLTAKARKALDEHKARYAQLRREFPGCHCNSLNRWSDYLSDAEAFVSVMESTEFESLA